jgi:excinuclease UvrABC nuclease subunit
MENPKDHRHFNIKQSKVPLDDFVSMEEVVYRSLQTPLDEKKEPRQLNYYRWWKYDSFICSLKKFRCAC